MTALTLTCSALLLPATGANAATQIGASYGVVGTNTVYGTATVAGAPKGARVVMESKGKKGAKVRSTRKVNKRGVAKLKWKFGAGAKTLTLRSRVITKRRKGRKKPKTLAVAPWKTLEVGALEPSAPVAPVKPANVVSAPVPGQPGTLVVQGAPKVEAGDVVAVGFGPATPDGLLAKAESVVPTGGATVISTTPATVPEVIPAGELDVTLMQDPLPGRRAATPLKKLASKLECSNGREAAVSGEASLTAGLSLNTKWKSNGIFSLPKLTAKFGGDVRAKVSAAAAITGEAECNMDPQGLFPSPIRLHQFATSIGPVPIVGVVYGQIYLYGSAEAKGEISTSVSATAGAAAGIEYDGSRFKPFGSADKSFTAQPPNVTASGNVQAHLAPAVDVRFYGLGGPELDFSAGLKLAADLTPAEGEPWWRLTAPLSAGVKFRLKAWRFDLESERFTVWDEEPELLRATTPPDGSTITEQGPSPDPLPEGIRTRLTWDSNTDVDLHTWDQDGNHAYFRDLDAIPTGFLDQDVIPGYGPETFQETEPGNTFTFGVCQYSGEQANVTVDTRDPDGQTRRFRVTLRGRKSASLITISPRDAENYIPEGGWCDDYGDPEVIGETSTGTFDEDSSRTLTAAEKINAETARLR